MLDTNAVSEAIKGNAATIERVVDVPMTSICISVITEAELLFGLAQRPEATKLARRIHEFLKRVTILPLDCTVAALYGPLRARLHKRGKAIIGLDLLIAAHALTANAILVTNDAAFRHVDGLQVEDWSKEP